MEGFRVQVSLEQSICFVFEKLTVASHLFILLFHLCQPSSLLWLISTFVLDSSMASSNTSCSLVTTRVHIHCYYGIRSPKP